jgi:hypothetical protein
MDYPDLMDLGVGAVFALMILREVFSFLNNRKSDSSDKKSQIENSMRLKEVLEDSEKCRKDIEWLRAVHDHRDEDGVYSWYIQPSLKREIHHLTATVSSLGSSIEKIVQVQSRQLDTLDKMIRTIEGLEE